MSPTPSIPDLPSHGPPHTSIALIAAALFCFLVFVYFSVHKRPSRRVRTTPSPPITNKKRSAKYRPKLWQVCLDEDHHPELARLDGAAHDWQPITAWANHRLGWRSHPRGAPQALPHAFPGSVAQGWFHDSTSAPPRSSPSPPLPIPDRRTLNVAVLVAMPSRRPPTQPIHGTVPLYPIGSRLSYGEGQLSIGTTTLSCSRQALSAALMDYELEQTT